MATQNSLAKQDKKPKFSVMMQQDTIKKLVNNTLGDPKKAEKFTASIISAVAVNPSLQECDGGTILSAALLGESLNLSPSPQLGHYYLVPFKNTKANKTDAQFLIGWKGYYQLAVRSGQYKDIGAVEIKEGELLKYNPLTGEIEVKPIENYNDREKAKTIGYYAYFELVNGFKKQMYWSKEKMEAHASQYSKGYAAKKGYTFWEKDFDGMALKTMYRQLISKYGIMSIEMQTAFMNDYSVTDDKGNKTYVDNDSDYLQVDVNEVIEEPKQQVVTPTNMDDFSTQTLL